MRQRRGQTPLIKGLVGYDIGEGQF
jgi:hypothetical protein